MTALVYKRVRGPASDPPAKGAGGALWERAIDDRLAKQSRYCGLNRHNGVALLFEHVPARIDAPSRLCRYDSEAP